MINICFSRQLLPLSLPFACFNKSSSITTQGQRVKDDEETLISLIHFLP